MLIDQGMVDLGRPRVTTDPLPTHNTGVVPPPLGGIHSIEFLGNAIFMMGWDGDAPQPICLQTQALVDTLVQEYGIQHHRSSAYRQQTNGAVKAANKNIKRILRNMVETSRDWSR